MPTSSTDQTSSNSSSTSTASQQQQQDRDYVGRTKDMGRESRLSFRHFAEHELRKEFKADALKECDLQVGAFAECIKTEGLWAPFRCRDIQKDVNDCMSFYNSEERFAVYLKNHQDDLDNKPYVQPIEK
jgi:Cytochrome c oxidase biogenesis protein Cmc1 like